MTRKFLYFLSPVLFLVISVSVINAQNTTTGSATTTANAPLELQQGQKSTNAGQINNTRALIQAKREAFKTGVQKIKDQRKKALVGKIDAKLAEINKKQTSRFSEVLFFLQGFLDRIKQTTVNVKVLTDIMSAQTAINTARDAVSAQAAKMYAMEITDDASLKANAGAVVSQFRQDINAVYKLVVDAKQAVQKLNTERNLIRQEATGSANL